MKDISCRDVLVSFITKDIDKTICRITAHDYYRPQEHIDLVSLLAGPTNFKFCYFLYIRLWISPTILMMHTKTGLVSLEVGQDGLQMYLYVYLYMVFFD